MTLEPNKLKVYVLGMAAKYKSRALTTIDRLITAGHTNIQLLISPHLITEVDKFKYYQRKWGLPEPGTDFGLGQMGCTVAHLTALETFLASNDNICMIVEDDLLLPPDWLPLFSKILSMISSYDILFLGWQRSTATIPSTQPFHLYYPFCAHCYMVTREGATKLLTAMKQHGITDTIDIWFVKYLQRYNINSQCVTGSYFLPNIPRDARADRADGIAFQDITLGSTL